MHKNPPGWLLLLDRVRAPDRPVARPRAGPPAGPHPGVDRRSMDIEITSASRKEQPAGDVAAAIFVITRDDIRRSGMTTIPDLLRLAPASRSPRSTRTNGPCRCAVSTTCSRTSCSSSSTGAASTTGSSPACCGTPKDLMLDDIERDRSHWWSRRSPVGSERRERRDQHHQRGPRARRRARSSASMPGAPVNRVPSATGGPCGSTLYRVFAQRTAGTNRCSRRRTGANDASESIRTGIRRRLDEPIRTCSTLEVRSHRPVGLARYGETWIRRRPLATRSWTTPDPTRWALICSAGGRTSAPAAHRCKYSPSPMSPGGRSRWSTMPLGRPSTSTRNTTRAARSDGTIWWSAPATGVDRGALRRTRRLFAASA